MESPFIKRRWVRGGRLELLWNVSLEGVVSEGVSDWLSAGFVRAREGGDAYWRFRNHVDDVTINNFVARVSVIRRSVNDDRQRVEP